MTIPKTLKIGAVIYGVRVVEDWPYSDGADGELFYDKKTGHVMFIRSTLTQEAQEASMLHEIFHALNSTIDHDFLDSFAEQIYAVLKENRLNFK